MAVRILYLKSLVSKPLDGEGVVKGDRFEVDSLLYVKNTSGMRDRRLLSSGAIVAENGDFIRVIDYPTRQEARDIVKTAGGISRCERM